MKIPEIIYLQIETSDGYDGDTTWCVDKINDADIKYMLHHSKYDEQEAMLREVRQAYIDYKKALELCDPVTFYSANTQKCKNVLMARLEKLKNDN